MFCGCLQAEERTFFVSIAQISSFVMNMAIFCPLFLFVFHMGTRGAALSTICSEGVSAIIFFFLYFFQKEEEELENINNQDEKEENIVKKKKCSSCHFEISLQTKN